MIGHNILNRNIWDNLKPNVKSNLEPYKDTFLKESNSSKGWDNTDFIDRERHKEYSNYPVGHMTASICQARSDHYLDYAKNNYQSGNYHKAAYWLGYALHYVQDMACPVHAAKIWYGNTYPGYTDEEIHLLYEGNWASKYGMNCSSMSSAVVTILTYGIMFQV